jgi:hypothetical protein
MSYDLLASVTEETLRYISDAVIFDDRGQPIILKEDNGRFKTKSCMHVLGFDTRFGHSVVLSAEKEVAHRVPRVLVRHPVQLDHVQEVKLYAGKLRENYEPPEGLYPWIKNVSFDGIVMHVVTDREAVSIEEFGNEI